MHSAKISVEEAQATEHMLSLCNALVQAACPVALLVGDLAAAEGWIAMLLEQSARHGLDLWHLRGRGFRGMLLNKAGDTALGLQLLDGALKELRETKYAGHYVAFLGALAEALDQAGQVERGLAAIEEALARSERTQARWCTAELLRIKGDLVLQQSGANCAAVAEDLFLKALDGARRQGALSWELRAATSLARQWQRHDRDMAARELLSPVYARFTEGFDTADLAAAKTLLDAL